MITLSKSDGIGGRIKAAPSSFVVKEITSSGRILEPGRNYTPEEIGEKEDASGKFCRFVLQKENWSTIDALKAVAKRFRRGVKSISYAGMKDRSSVSVQIAALFDGDPEQLLALKIKDIRINAAWKAKEGVRMGELTGNSFDIRVDDAEKPENIERVLEELDGVVPNYFDRQRFGLRLNNQRVGIHIIRGEFEEAVMEMLTDTGHETSPDAIDARNKLEEERDFKAAASYFPKYLRNERKVIDYLARYPGNFANAIREVPRGNLLMFVHAVEDTVFNLSLEEWINNGREGNTLSCGANFYGFPDTDKVGNAKDEFPVGVLLGYETAPEDISGIEKEVMERMGITTEMFKIKGMPELSCKGSFRPLVVRYKNEAHSASEDSARISFDIPSGAYATVLLNEITKSDTRSMAEILSISS